MSSSGVTGLTIHLQKTLPMRYTTVSNDTIIDLSGIEGIEDPLTDILCDGARRLLCAAIEAEPAEFLKQHEDRRTVQGRKAVVRNGYHPERSIQTGLGPVSVRILKVRANDGEPVTFRSSVVPRMSARAARWRAGFPGCT